MLDEKKPCPWAYESLHKFCAHWLLILIALVLTWLRPVDLLFLLWSIKDKHGSHKSVRSPDIIESSSYPTASIFYSISYWHSLHRLPADAMGARTAHCLHTALHWQCQRGAVVFMWEQAKKQPPPPSNHYCARLSVAIRQSFYVLSLYSGIVSASWGRSSISANTVELSCDRLFTIKP